jgi:hypothetical protein
MLNLQNIPAPSSTGLEHGRFGGGVTETVLHPLVLVAMLAAIIAVLCLPRRIRLAAFLFSTFLIPAGQQFLIGGVHVFVYRVIVLAGCLGFALARRSRETTILAGGWNSIDRAFLLYICFHVVAFSLLYSNGAALVNQVGYVWDFAGGYLLLRNLIRNEHDVNRAIKCFAWLAVILAICMVREQITGENIFGRLGGVRWVSQVREGRIRSEGVFQHAILAGTFGATLMPLLLWLWKTGKARVLCVGGVIASAVIAVTTACSTPLATYGAGIAAICFWPFRRRMRVFRWGLVITLIALHLGMKAPVWALIGRMDFVGGSSGHHRYELVDQFIRHVGDWWLLGTKSNADWGFEMIDTSNQYVEEGSSGGGLAFIFFIVLITCSFRKLGVARKALGGQDRLREWLLWLLGASLFAHIVAFFGIFYFDQMRVAWLALLAMISAATSVRAVHPKALSIQSMDRAGADLQQLATYEVQPLGLSLISGTHHGE